MNISLEKKTQLPDIQILNKVKHSQVKNNRDKGTKKP